MTRSKASNLVVRSSSEAAMSSCSFDALRAGARATNELGGKIFGAICVGVEALDTNCHELTRIGWRFGDNQQRNLGRKGKNTAGTRERGRVRGEDRLSIAI